VVCYHDTYRYASLVLSSDLSLLCHQTYRCCVMSERHSNVSYHITRLMAASHDVPRVAQDKVRYRQGLTDTCHHTHMSYTHVTIHTCHQRYMSAYTLVVCVILTCGVCHRHMTYVTIYTHVSLHHKTCHATHKTRVRIVSAYLRDYTHVYSLVCVACQQLSHVCKHLCVASCVAASCV